MVTIEMKHNNDALTMIMRQLHTVVFFFVFLVGIGTSPSAMSAIYAFGREISLPMSTPSGVVLARHYISPLEACGKPTCNYSQILNYPNGGQANAPGPTIATNVPGVSTRFLINGQAYPTMKFTPALQSSQPLEVQLLSNGQPIRGGSLAGINASGSASYFILYSQEQGTNYQSIYLNGKITPISGTCSVPAQTVTLPTAPVRNFGDIGSTAGSQNFRIQINNCPAGYNRIGYTLSPVGGMLSSSSGVLPLTGDSTASGVNIRITDDQGIAAVFGMSKMVNAYNKATGGSYMIPMQASYIKTDETIKPGTVNGAMTVLLDYQ